MEQSKRQISLLDLSETIANIAGSNGRDYSTVECIVRTHGVNRYRNEIKPTVKFRGYIDGYSHFEADNPEDLIVIARNLFLEKPEPEVYESINVEF